MAKTPVTVKPVEFCGSALADLRAFPERLGVKPVSRLTACSAVAIRKIGSR
jgi:hypothetical protein